jgi:hypothetical protein
MKWRAKSVANSGKWSENPEYSLIDLPIDTFATSPRKLALAIGFGHLARYV